MAKQPILGWFNDVGISIIKKGKEAADAVGEGWNKLTDGAKKTANDLLKVGKSLGETYSQGLGARSGDALESTKTPFTATMYFLGALVPLVLLALLIYFLCFYDGLCCSGKSLFGGGDGPKMAALKGKSGKEKSAAGKSSAPTTDGKTATSSTNTV